MVKHSRDDHVSEENLIQAVIDPEDLSLELREHLDSCQFCRLDKERLEGSLIKLGDLAQKYAPTPQKIQMVATAQVRRHWAYSWNLATAVTAALLIAAVTWWAIPLTKSPNMKSPGIGLDALTLQMDQDAELLNRIEYLEDNPLPLALADISGESSLDLNEDFLDFVNPSEDNDQSLVPPVSRRGQGKLMALSPQALQLWCMPVGKINSRA